MSNKSRDVSGRLAGNFTRLTTIGVEDGDGRGVELGGAATLFFAKNWSASLGYAGDIRSGDILMAHLGIWSRQDPWAPAVLAPLITGLKARGLCFATLRELAHASGVAAAFLAVVLIGVVVFVLVGKLRDDYEDLQHKLLLQALDVALA